MAIQGQTQLVDCVPNSSDDTLLQRKDVDVEVYSTDSPEG